MPVAATPRRVLHIVEATLTGVGQHVHDLIQYADRQHFAPALCYSLERSDQRFRNCLPDLRRSGTPLYEIPMHRALRPKVNVRALVRIRRLLDTERFDIVHAHSAIGGMLGRTATIGRTKPIVIYTPNGWPFLSTADRRLARGYQWLERMAGKRTDHIICVSRREAAIGLNLRIVPKERISVITNGIDRTRVIGDRNRARHALGIPDDTMVLGTVTRFAYQKNPEFLLRALAPVLQADRRTRLVLVGDGPLLDTAKHLARTLEIGRQTLFAGFRMDATALLFGYDIFLLPSRYEGLSYALLEAMAAGLPVVTSCGGEDAITDGENGFLIPAGDEVKLRGASERLLSDAALRSKMGELNRIKILQFSVREQVRLTEALYDRLLAQHARTRI